MNTLNYSMTWHGLENLKEAPLDILEAALQDLLSGIEDLDHASVEAMQKRLDSLTKPQGSLGILEDLAKQLAGIQRTTQPIISEKAVLVMAGDHGVVEEGVSAFPQEVTPQMLYNINNGGAGINVLSRQAGAQVICTDIGVAFPLDPPSLMSYRVKNGTANMTQGPAMTRKEALQALLTGAQIASAAIDSGVNLLGTGELGIGNTTPSAALVSVFTGLPVRDVTGRGTGIDDATLLHKQEVIERALEINHPDSSAPLDTLAQVGGLEIAALVGAILEAACRKVPIVLDGIISTAAALVAAQLAPLSIAYMISSHGSVEQGHRLALQHLGLKPKLNFHMRLGEGTGAALMFPIIEAALKIVNEMATFESAGVSQEA